MNISSTSLLCTRSYLVNPLNLAGILTPPSTPEPSPLSASSSRGEVRLVIRALTPEERTSAVKEWLQQNATRFTNVLHLNGKTQNAYNEKDTLYISFTTLPKRSCFPPQ